MNKKNDRNLMALSILVAIIMWAFVMTSTNPSLSKTVRNVPLTIKNQEALEKAGFAIVGKDEISSVNVKVEGARSDIVGISNDDLIASVDLGSPSEGIKTLSVKVEGPSGVRFESVNPSNINFKIEKIVEKTMPIEVKVEDKLKDSKIIETTDQYPREITISGLRENIDKVDKIQLFVNDERYLDGKIHDIAAIPIDKAGDPVQNINLSSSSVSISFDVLASKEVEVKLETSGNLPGSMKIKESEISPKTVVIKGETKTIDKINSISTKKLNLSEVNTLSYKTNLELNLPKGVELGDNNDSVEVDLIVGK